MMARKFKRFQSKNKKTGDEINEVDGKKIIWA
jgi:hypothetical protein